MASKKTLNANNLEALGARHLAELLMELSQGDAAAKRRLRLALAGTISPGEIAKQVRKRLTTIARSRSFVDWYKRPALAEDLETQRRAIVDQIAPADPGEGLALMWRFLALSGSIFERCDDSDAMLGDLFHTAVDNLGGIAESAKADPDTLADAAYQALTNNDYGQYDRLIRVLAPALGPPGLEQLKQRMVVLSREPVQKPAAGERRIIGYGSAGPVYADEMAEHSRISTARLALQEIADAQGDVDGFIDQYDEQTRQVPKVAAAIARRLLAADRAPEAWQALAAAEETHGGRRWPDFEWEDARIEALEALGRGDEAQAVRWSCFERSLSAAHLRAYLQRCADDFEAEEQALDHAQAYPSLLQALSFFVSWPELDHAARLVIRRAAQLDGNLYQFLTPAAEALADRHPLAATLLLRAMIDFTLSRKRTTRYKHAARHLAACARLAAAVADFGSFDTHAGYETRLRQAHHAKNAFWRLVE